MANKRLREEMFETARGLYDLGMIDAETLHRFDASKLAPVNPIAQRRLNVCG